MTKPCHAYIVGNELRGHFTESNCKTMRRNVVLIDLCVREYNRNSIMHPLTHQASSFYLRTNLLARCLSSQANPERGCRLSAQLRKPLLRYIVSDITGSNSSCISLNRSVDRIITLNREYYAGERSEPHRDRGKFNIYRSARLDDFGGRSVKQLEDSLIKLDRRDGQSTSRFPRFSRGHYEICREI